MFHVTSVQNRAAILRYGLDWRLMGTTHGIAGEEPELPVVFLCDSRGDVSFFIAMARAPSDVSAVRVDGLWTEPGPDGGTIIGEIVPPERLRLVQHEGVNVKTAQARLGHANPQTTLRIHAQATSRADRQAAERIGKRFRPRDGRGMEAVGPR